MGQAEVAEMFFFMADYLIRKHIEPYVRCTRVVRNRVHEFRAGERAVTVVRDGENSSQPWVRVTFKNRDRFRLRLNAEKTQMSVRVGGNLVNVDVTVTPAFQPNKFHLVFRADMSKQVYKAVIFHVVRAFWEY